MAQAQTGMPMSFRLFNVGETEVRIHATFFLLLAWVAVVYGINGGTVAAIDGVIFVSILFACVVAHEFGHVLTARRYGIRTPHITLLPIGGVASLERMPEKPGQEIAVALAGPAVNVVIAAALILLTGLPTDTRALIQFDPDAGLLPRVATANLFLAVFNMLPAFPMDGGRVLRAVLGLRFGRAQATRIAATVGQVLAFGLGFLGLLGNPLLILIALFIYFAAGAEAQQAEMRDLSEGRTAADAMITAYEALSPQATADDAVQLLLRTTQQEFPVVDGGGRLRGLVRREALVRVLRETGGGTPVIDFMDREVPVVAPDAALVDLLAKLTDGRTGAVGVAGADGRLQGYVSAENVAEIFMVTAARQLGERRNKAGPRWM